MDEEPSRPQDDIPGLVNTALTKANTPANIIGEFKKCGVCHYDRDIFKDFFYKFAPADKTGQPDPSKANNDVENTSLSSCTAEAPDSSQTTETPLTTQPQPEPVDIRDKEEPSTFTSCRKRQSFTFPQTVESSAQEFSPELVRPLSMAPAKGTKRKAGRKSLKSAILIDTPENNAIKKKKERTATKAKRQLKKNKGAKQQRGNKAKATKEVSPGAEEWSPFFHQYGQHISNSATKDDWVKCMVEGCDEWAHELCTDDGKSICTECDA